MFGIPEVRINPVAPAAAPSRGPATQVFGLREVGSNGVSAPAAPTSRGPATQMFGQGVPKADPPSEDHPVPEPAVRPARAARGTIELPPESAAAIPEESADDPEALFRAQIKRRNRVALGAGVALLLAFFGFVGVKMVGQGRPELPSELATQRDNVLALLRRDDRGSIGTAAQQLTELVQKGPQYLELRAALLLVTALKLDDARLEIRRLGADSEELNKKINRLKETKKPGDWENRVNAMVDALATLKKQSDPLIDQAAALDTEVNKNYRELMAGVSGTLSAAEELALVRAQAIYYGVKGSDQVEKLIERYRLLGKSANDGWAEVAFAEYSANARVSPETLVKARAAMDELRSADSTFLRPYVLSARLAMGAKQFDAAAGALEAVLLLEPKHEVASKLLAWVKQEAAAAAKPAAR
jgi:hypothetical protein